MTTENKQNICSLLCETLKATRDQQDLKSLTFQEIGPDVQEVVVTYENGGHFSINVSMDSGIAMIRDIVNHIG